MAIFTVISGDFPKRNHSYAMKEFTFFQKGKINGDKYNFNEVKNLSILQIDEKPLGTRNDTKNVFFTVTFKNKESFIAKMKPSAFVGMMKECNPRFDTSDVVVPKKNNTIIVICIIGFFALIGLNVDDETKTYMLEPKPVSQEQIDNNIANYMRDPNEFKKTINELIEKRNFPNARNRVQGLETLDDKDANELSRKVILERRKFQAEIEEKRNSATPTKSYGEGDALYDCEQLVKASLTYPSSYNSSMFSKGTKSMSDGSINVLIDFSAKNGFGNELPQSAMCKINNGTLVSFDIVNR